MKDRIINGIIDREGGYVNDPSDSGGETNYGITVAVARRARYAGKMRDMSRETAFNIYANKYWNLLQGDALEALNPAIAEEVIDTGVNMGVNRAATFLQSALNAFNNGGTRYNDLVVDGKLGVNTLKALNAYLQGREHSPLLKALNCLQGSFYIDLAERREKDEKFIYGWFKNRVEI